MPDAFRRRHDRTVLVPGWNRECSARTAGDPGATLASTGKPPIWVDEMNLRSESTGVKRCVQVRGSSLSATHTVPPFSDSVMLPGFRVPSYTSGVYLRDPLFATAVRVAVDMGYRLVAYEESAPAPARDHSFRARRQAENLRDRSRAYPGSHHIRRHCHRAYAGRRVLRCVRFLAADAAHGWAS